MLNSLPGVSSFNLFEMMSSSTRSPALTRSTPVPAITCAGKGHVYLLAPTTRMPVRRAFEVLKGKGGKLAIGVGIGTHHS